MRKILGIAGLALLVSSPVSAQAVHDGITPQQFARVVQSMGYKAEVKKTAKGSPFVSSASSGQSFIVFFYTCGKDERCKSAQWFAHYATKGADKADVAEWNRTKRYLTATRAADGDLSIKMDARLAHVTDDYIKEVFRFWASFMGNFDTYRRNG